MIIAPKIEQEAKNLFDEHFPAILVHPYEGQIVCHSLDDVNQWKGSITDLRFPSKVSYRLEVFGEAHCSVYATIHQGIAELAKGSMSPDAILRFAANRSKVNKLKLQFLKGE